MLPFMPTNVKKTRKSIKVFGGINDRLDKGDGELTDSVNMCARDFPYISSRKKRSTPKVTGVNICQGGYNNSPYYLGNTPDDEGSLKIFTNDNSALISDSYDPSQKRQSAAMGDKILVVPDNTVYDSSDNTVYKVDYEKYVDYNIAKENIKTDCHITSLFDHDYHVATMTSSKIYSSSYSSGNYTSYYMALEDLKAGDIVHISAGITIETSYDSVFRAYEDYMEKGFDVVIKDVVTTTYKTYPLGTIKRITALEFESDALNTGGYGTVYLTYINIKRRIPPLEYICSLNNRIWGVYKNTIQCSKLGDCSQWYDYSADQYGTLPSSCFSTEVNSQGEFTGIVPYGGNILAFKENCMHKLYGSEPNNYTISTLDCKGVKSGCGNTISVINGVVYYMGSDGVYRYSGGMPKKVSHNINMENISPICSATDGNNYYLLASENDNKYMFVFYPEGNLWHKQAVPADTSTLISVPDNVIIAYDTSVMNVIGAGDEENFTWSFTLSFNEKTYSKKGYGKILLCYYMENGGELSISLSSPDNDSVNYKKTVKNSKKKSYREIAIPIIPCKDLILTVSGSEKITIVDITREYFIAPEENEKK